MIIDERIANYAKMIEQETDPVFKMLYELNRDLLIKLKNVKYPCCHRSKTNPFEKEEPRNNGQEYQRLS